MLNIYFTIPRLMNTSIISLSPPTENTIIHISSHACQFFLGEISRTESQRVDIPF